MSQAYPDRSGAVREMGGEIAPGSGPYPIGSRGGGPVYYYERVQLDVDANPATAKTDKMLTKACRRAIVYNYTTCYVLIVDADVWVPPFMFGAVIAFTSAVTVGKVRYEPPPAQAQPAGVVGNRCVVFFTEEPIEPNPGVRYTP